jgi:glycosidase
VWKLFGLALFLTPEGPDGDGGYAITDYRKIDPKLGSMDDFKGLLGQAHQRGLRVYTDFVLSHTASDHDWFHKTPSFLTSAQHSGRS